jgi:enoyl-CoA hydratase/carnithine racemase
LLETVRLRIEGACSGRAGAMTRIDEKAFASCRVTSRPPCARAIENRPEPPSRPPRTGLSLRVVCSPAASDSAIGYTTAMSWELERADDVVIVRMTGTKANVQNEVFFKDLHAAFDRLESEFTDCAVVLTSADACFSAGIDFESAFAILASSDHAMMADWIRRYQATNLRVWSYPRPTVAAINGHAYAGGVITALDCDYRVAADGVRFSLNEVPIGIAMPAVYVEIIRFAVGDPAAALTTLFGREYDTADALRLGFVHAVTT